MKAYNITTKRGKIVLKGIRFKDMLKFKRNNEEAFKSKELKVVEDKMRYKVIQVKGKHLSYREAQSLLCALGFDEGYEIVRDYEHEKQLDFNRRHEAKKKEMLNICQ